MFYSFLIGLPSFPPDFSVYRLLIDLLGILGIAIAASYYIAITKSSNQTRKAQLFMQIYDVFRSEEFMKKTIDIMNLQWNNFDDYINKYGIEKNPSANAMIFSVGNYLEGVGVLIKRKLIDVVLVDDLMTGIIERWWEKMGPIIKQLRVAYNWPEAYEWTEYLYNTIRKSNVNKR